MTGSEAVTTAEAQARAATGHARLAGGAMVPAPWVPTTGGSGSTLCTAADLGRFLRAVVAGDPPLLAPAAREAMLTPALPIPDGGYGFGLGVELDDEAGYRRIGHQGDCPGYCSYAYGCLETGVGVVALGNGPWRPPSEEASAWAVVEHGLALLRAAALGRELPRPTGRRSRAGRRPAAGLQAGARPPGRAGRPGRDLRGLEPVAAPDRRPPRRRRRRARPGLARRRRRASGPAPGGGFRLGDDPDSPDRVHFGAEVEGRPMQAVVSGWPFDRVD